MHQLSIAELASHTHIQNAHSHQYAVPQTGTGIGSGTQLGTPSANAATAQTTAVNQNAGSDTAHNTMQPFLALNKLIKYG
jgi:microcystin-dependent protein